MTDEVRERLRQQHLLYLSAGPADQLSAAALTSDQTMPGHSSEVLDLADHDVLTNAIRQRTWFINFVLWNTLNTSRTDIGIGVGKMAEWIKEQSIVRVIGAGRALFAATLPGNRLAHAGARVYFQGDKTPLPNSAKGGAVLAASASGKTPSVLAALKKVRERNPSIFILGIADAEAHEFSDLCDLFIGIDHHHNPYVNPLPAMADTGEYVISELLDAMVVAAAKRLGLSEDDLRAGHEDIVDTGPYLPRTSEHE